MNCRWCGGQDHSRVSSKKCKKYSKWKELKTAEAKKVFHKSQCATLIPSHIANTKRKSFAKKNVMHEEKTHQSENSP